MDGITAKMQAYERALDTAQAEIATLRAQVKSAQSQAVLREAAFYETRMWRGWWKHEVESSRYSMVAVWSNAAPCRGVAEAVRATDDAALAFDNEYGFPFHAVVTMLLDSLEACRTNDATKYDYKQPRHLDQKPPKQGGRWATPFEIAGDAISEYAEMVFKERGAGVRSMRRLNEIAGTASACEGGCGPAVTSDSEGVNLCQKCADMLSKEGAASDE